MTVTALLVSHEGARWLPAVLTGLRDQQLPPDRILAVDTGSGADTLGLLTDALGSDAVHSYDGSFPDAVRHALAMIDTEWVWILHDDANPDPRALLELVAAAETHDADIFGPKLREWPSLRRLLELGVTISATGRRETGLERGEYDQGQHDEVREMLAVNTAGMLVRREVLEKLGGFDPELPLFATDLDFGWRAARAGHRTLVVPQAVVFHAEAGHRGQRRTKLLGRRTRTHRAEREAALFVLLANDTGRRLPWQVVRLFFGSFVRMLGYLLVRSPGHAADELVALFNVYSRPGRIRAARRSRRAAQQAEPVDVRRLLSPWWVPYRHGLDAVSDLATAATNEGRDAAERRRAARMEAAAQAQGSLGAHSHSGRVSHSDDEDEAMAPDSGLLVRIVTSPLAMALDRVRAGQPVRRPRGLLAARRGRALSGAGRGRRLVAAGHRGLAPDRAGHRRPRAGLRPAVRARREHPVLHAPAWWSACCSSSPSRSPPWAPGGSAAWSPSSAPGTPRPPGWSAGPRRRTP